MWPRTLFGRTALIIAASLIIAQSTFLVLAHLSFSRLHVHQITTLIQDNVHTVATARRLLPPVARRRFDQRLTRPTMRLRDQVPRSGAVGPFPAAVTRALSHAGTPAVAQPRPGGVTVNVAVGAHHWLAIDLPGLPSRLPWPRIGFLVVGLLVTGSGALLLVRRVNRPLAALAAAASAFGRGQSPGPLPIDGPVEVARVCVAFNRMTTDARRYEDDRALLLAGVSHDLRTPLARMRLAVELVPPADTALRDGMIQDIAEMDGILAEFLAYARHGVEETPTTGDLHHLIADIIHRYDRQGATIHFQPGTVGPFAFRPVAVTRLIGNIIDNAVRHAGGDVTVTTGSDGHFAVITVADRGPGLRDSERQRLAAGHPLSEGRQRGLGLAVASRIAAAHGGTLTLDNRDGGGLEATIRLPLAGPPSVEGAAGPHPQHPQDRR